MNHAIRFAASAARPSARLALATLLVAGAAVFTQTAWAMPGGHGGPGMHGGGMGMMGGEGRGMERMFELVNATPEQRSQIQAILRSARDQGQGQREQHRQLQQQAMTLFSQPTVDARAAEQLRQQMLAQHDAGSRRWMQTMLEISRVLTPEQRKTLADKMAERRAQMERRHGGGDRAPR